MKRQWRGKKLSSENRPRPAPNCGGRPSALTGWGEKIWRGVIDRVRNIDMRSGMLFSLA